MNKYSLLIFVTIITGIFISFSACDTNTNVGLEESLASVYDVTPIEGAQDEAMQLKHGDSQDSFFSVQLADGLNRDGWCIEWNEDANFGIQNGVKLFSTKGHEEWNALNYFMSIKDDLRAEDPELTFREIQVIIWSLIENPSFDVSKISEYDNISSRIYADGQLLFDIEKVKSILSKVKSHLEDKVIDKIPGVTLIENDGQTIMVGNETAYAVKTKGINGDTIVDDDYSTCFDEEIMPGVSFNNWGWTNGPLSDPSGPMTYAIYAGAGQCDLNKGTKVGELAAEYSNGTLTVTYTMTETSGYTGSLYTLEETHVYAGNDPYPKNPGGKYTVAPGQYGNQETHDNITEYTYEIDGLSGDIYFIAHAVVSGFNPEE
ncbi:hypothetical protein [Fodinibius salsisoli]|uniref:Uncharacterized protein n=1 Tax=Fodinibius salsisoli TaxID=2820877 RepID=A0ABT3PLK9_9BACT|nr:hypothetical protein [Fodinibius salsisoli]MCW9706750.1 hypothetical protein [Fodinibius salsisoli]